VYILLHKNTIENANKHEYIVIIIIVFSGNTSRIAVARAGLAWIGDVAFR
jgi:hypothetical protein